MMRPALLPTLSAALIATVPLAWAEDRPVGDPFGALGYSDHALGRAIGPIALEGRVDKTFRQLGCADPGKRVVVKKNTVLDPACIYRAEFIIKRSGVTLDCRGAVIAGKALREKPGGAVYAGVLIASRADRPLRDVTVRNCSIDGFGMSVQVSRRKWNTLKKGREFRNGFENIVISNSRLTNAAVAGVYLTPFVNGVTMRRLDISGAGEMGIYFESGTTGNAVIDSAVHHNGYRMEGDNKVSQRLGFFKITATLTGREGIAVDGAFNNRIVGNRIYNNAAGGIFVYKNCGEQKTWAPKRWFERPYGADNNLIQGNRIENEKTGIWIGSRASQNQFFMDCSDPAYKSGVLFKVHADPARGNQVIDNQLINVRYGIRVEGDKTIVRGNRFQSRNRSHQAILVGTLYRGDNNQPIKGVSLLDNAAQIAGNPAPFVDTGGATPPALRGNRANGTATGLRSGPYPKPTPYLFVTEWSPKL